LFIVGVPSFGIVISAEEPISFNFDPIVPKPKKARKINWEFNKVFQDIWIAKLLWVEVMMGPNGKLSTEKCKV